MDSIIDISSPKGNRQIKATDNVDVDEHLQLAFEFCRRSRHQVDIGTADVSSQSLVCGAKSDKGFVERALLALPESVISKVGG